MGAKAIYRTRAGEQMRQLRRLRKELRTRPGSRHVTIIQDEATKRVLGVAIDRDAAARFRETHGGMGELIDMPLEV